MKTIIQYNFLSRLLSPLTRRLNSGDGRTVKAVYNILASFLIKGGSIVVTFLMVPMTLGYLNSYEYGIWLTLNSVLTWIGLLDIGLGSGMKNKLAEARANSNFNLGKEYVSTTFFIMTVIVAVFYLIFLIVQNFLDWNSLLNASASAVPRLNSIVTIVVGCVCLTFLLKMIGGIYTAYQLPAVNDLLALAGNTTSLLIIYILTKTTNGSLESVALTFSLAPGIVYLIAIPVTFVKFKEIKPSLRSVRLNLFGELINLGGQFFIIQIAVMLLYMSSNIVISKIFGPQEVTPYNIAFRYFSILTLVFNIILSPIWTAVTDAKERGDIEWINKSLARLLKLWCGMLVVIVLMVLCADIFYKFWIQDKVLVPFSLNVWSGIYIAITSLCSIYANIVNGYGKVTVQLIFSVIQTLIYIPVAMICSRYFGISGILIALCIVAGLSLLWSPYQSYKLIRGRATGIWNR